MKETEYLYTQKHYPLIENPPSENCYCVKLDSQSIISILKYCDNKYLECEIYKSFNNKIWR